MSDKLGLTRDYEVEQRAITVVGRCRLWVVPRHHVIGEAPDGIHIPACRKELEGADPDVARGDPGQYRAGQRPLTPNSLTGRHRGERAGRRDSERSKGLADNVLAQDRPERCAAVTLCRENGVGPAPLS